MASSLFLPPGPHTGVWGASQEEELRGAQEWQDFFQDPQLARTHSVGLALPGGAGGNEDPGQAREVQGHRWKRLLSNTKTLPSVLTTSRRKCPFSTNVSLILVMSFEEQE